MFPLTEWQSKTFTSRNLGNFLGGRIGSRVFAIYLRYSGATLGSVLMSVGSAWETNIAVPGMELGSATCKESASPVPISDPIYDLRCEDRSLNLACLRCKIQIKCFNLYHWLLMSDVLEVPVASKFYTQFVFIVQIFTFIKKKPVSFR